MIFKFLVRWFQVSALTILLGLGLFGLYSFFDAIVTAIVRYPDFGVGAVAFLCITALITAFTLLKK